MHYYASVLLLNKWHNALKIIQFSKNVVIVTGLTTTLT